MMVEIMMWVIVFATYAVTFFVGVMFGVFYLYTNVMNGLKNMGPPHLNAPQPGDEWKEGQNPDDKDTSWLRRILDNFGKDKNEDGK